MIKFLTSDNKTIESKISEILSNVQKKLDNSSSLIRDSLKTTVQNHFRVIYPGSTHYDPSKVSDGNIQSNGNVVKAEINIDVPGITRAYRSLDIKPKMSRYLTIPIHQQAYGKKASEFNDMIFIKNKKNKFLAIKNGEYLTFMYLLSEGVHQQRDSRLMPSDETLKENIFARLIKYLSSTQN